LSSVLWDLIPFIYTNTLVLPPFLYESENWTLSALKRRRIEAAEMKGLGGETGGKEPLGRPRRRWVDNSKMDLQEVGCGYVNWIGLAQDRDRWRTLVSAVMNLRVP